jgi:hypothetical protein
MVTAECAALFRPTLAVTVIVIVPNPSTLAKTADIPYLMVDERFEWRDAKAAENFRDHGVTFDKAVKAFSDPFAIEWIDQSEA